MCKGIKDISTVLPTMMFSLFLISFLSGSRYDSDFVSGKIDVCHLDEPTDAMTLTDPNPRVNSSIVLMVFPISTGIVIKCHEFSPLYSHTSALNLKLLFIGTIIRMKQKGSR